MSKMADGAAFKEAYASLNAAQKEAVDTIEGPVMVIAGPGTGKTQILTLRIANILLSTDTKPESILALTFTESGARAMRERLRTYIGATAYQVPIYTFHGFAGQLIREYPDAYPHIIGGKPASDLEKIAELEAVLESGEYKELRPIGNPSYYVTPLLSMISDLKQENIEPDDLAIILEKQEEEIATIPQFHEKGTHKGRERGEYTKKARALAKNRELLSVYRAYIATMQSRNKYDFDDMILDTVHALETNENLLRDLQERYQYFLADEHQDVNGAQNRILELLASFHDQPNMFVVGDEKQAIYRFQGASLENFLYFEDVFPGTKTIALTENYRSTQSILDASHDLVSVEDGPLKELRVPLTAVHGKGDQPTLRTFPHQAVEDDWLIKSVAADIESGVSPAEIAVIVRTNREVEDVAASLRDQGITATASADGDILTHPLTQSVMALMTTVVEPSNEAALFSVLHEPYWGISPADLVRLLSKRSYDLSLAQLLTDTETLGSVGLQDTEAISRVGEVLSVSRKLVTTEPPHRVLHQVLHDSGLVTHVMEQQPLESGRVLRRLYDEIESLVRDDGEVSLSGVLTLLKKRQAYGLPLNAPYINVAGNAVQVMTAHKAKGLEFDVVYMPHLSDSLWGGRARRQLFSVPLTKHLQEGDFDPLDDERRLLYVGMTRAKKELRFSVAEVRSDGKELLPSRLLSDVTEERVKQVTTDSEVSTFDPLSRLNTATSSITVDSELFLIALKERGFSATSLNNFLTSPWNYVYRNVLRIPEVQALPLLYGTAVHNVLQKLTQKHTDAGELLAVSVLRDLIDSELQKLPLSAVEYTQLHEKALTSLTIYRAHLVATLPKTTREEMKLTVMLPTGLETLPEVPLTGMLDRLDFDGEGKVARVVDYKTGKAKSRNDIEGKTKTSSGDYKRQLTFYALLLQLHGDDRYVTRTGTLSFVEPVKGVIKEETFEITDAEIEALKTTIIEAVESIATGQFLTEPCDPAVSDYCNLVSILLETRS